MTPKAKTTPALVYEDDFDTLDFNKYLTRYWYVDPNWNGCSLPSNGELQLYVNHDGPMTAVPWTCENSILKLTAWPISPPQDGYDYLSGMINSYNGFYRTYGFFEARIKMPPGNGMWPAFWLLPMDGSWPPEIDVVEWLGRDPLTEYLGTHSGIGGGNVPQGGPYPIPDGAADFHTYGVDWQLNTISFTFDGETVVTFPTPADMHKPMYFILNLALGGGWAGAPDESTPWPASMEIDWVHVYESNPYAPDSGGGGGDLPPLTPPGTTYVISNPWGAADLRAVYKPGDKVSLAFGYDDLQLVRSAVDTYVWARQGVSITLAVILPGMIAELGVPAAPIKSGPPGHMPPGREGPLPWSGGPPQLHGGPSGGHRS
jgi:beta-glucanase (GH16 family)